MFPRLTGNDANSGTLPLGSSNQPNSQVPPPAQVGNQLPTRSTTSGPPPRGYLHVLPQEAIEEIAENLSPNERTVLALTSRQFRNAMSALRIRDRLVDGAARVKNLRRNAAPDTAGITPIPASPPVPTLLAIVNQMQTDLANRPTLRIAPLRELTGRLPLLSPDDLLEGVDALLGAIERLPPKYQPKAMSLMLEYFSGFDVLYQATIFDRILRDVRSWRPQNAAKMVNSLMRALTSMYANAQPMDEPPAHLNAEDRIRWTRIAQLPRLSSGVPESRFTQFMEFIDSLPKEDNVRADALDEVESRILKLPKAVKESVRARLEESRTELNVGMSSRHFATLAEDLRLRSRDEDVDQDVFNRIQVNAFRDIVIDVANIQPPEDRTAPIRELFRSLGAVGENDRPEMFHRLAPLVLGLPDDHHRDLLPLVIRSIRWLPPEQRTLEFDLLCDRAMNSQWKSPESVAACAENLFRLPPGDRESRHANLRLHLTSVRPEHKGDLLSALGKTIHLLPLDKRVAAYDELIAHVPHMPINDRDAGYAGCADSLNCLPSDSVESRFHELVVAKESLPQRADASLLKSSLAMFEVHAWQALYGRGSRAAAMDDA